METACDESRKRTTTPGQEGCGRGKKGEEFSEPILGTVAVGHHYDVETVQLAVQQVIISGNSLRAVEKNFKLAAEESETSIPSFISIRNWLGRIGLYELKREKEHRDDWIFIVDLTMQLGKQKCLLVLGVTQQYLSEHVLPFKQGLKHQDVEVLMLEIMESTRGELIEEKLSKLTDTVGCPVQIIADHGSDLEKGIKLYNQKYPAIIYTYDVTHGMALILQHELATSKKYQAFVERCNLCRNQSQQTDLSFLSPPSQRSQCRFFNVEKLINWGQNMLSSSIDVISRLTPNMEPKLLKQKLDDKFGWLTEYQEDIKIWSEMVEMTRILETYLKNNGINQQSLSNFEFLLSCLNFNVNPDFKQKILDYLITESSQIPPEVTFLATSDVIESLFGKYKQFSSRCPIQQIGQTVLSICLCTMKLTTSVVKEALETIRYLDLKAWSSQVFGQSMLSQRRIVFSC